MGVTSDDILANVIAGIIVALLGTVAGVAGGWVLLIITNYFTPSRKSSNVFIRLLFNFIAALIIILSPSKLDDAQGVNKAIAGIPAILTGNAVIVRKDGRKENVSSGDGSDYSGAIGYIGGGGDYVEESSSDSKVAQAIERLRSELRWAESTYDEFLEEFEFDEEFKIGNPYQRLENQRAEIDRIKEKIRELEEYI